MTGAARPTRRDLLGLAAAASASSLLASQASARGRSSARGGPLMVGSANALAGMKLSWKSLVDGADPLDAAIETVKVVEADPDDTSVGLGGLPNEDGVVSLDAACMHGPTHNSGAVAAIENILHPSEVARLVMERTDHCMIVGRGAYELARAHGHPHTELLTEKARKRWLDWLERHSAIDDRLPPLEAEDEKHGSRARSREELDAADEVAGIDWSTYPRHGTVHCSALAPGGDVACTTTTSGLAFKIPGRVGDSPIVGAGLYCDQEVGSAGSTGRGEAAILANGSFAIVELMRQGKGPLDAGLEVLRRIARQTQRMATWQPGLIDAEGRPSFNVKFYVLSLDGRWAGVALRGEGDFAVADGDAGPRLEPLVPLFG